MSESLLPLSASAQERSAEAATARVGEIPAPLATTWNPDTCPTALLPWLAWALSVDSWDNRWPEPVKRMVIRESVMVHRKKGTRGALERALRALGMRIELEEWFEYGGEPHHFQLTALANAALASGNEAILDQDFYRTVHRAVEAVKPVRSHYELRVGASYATGVKVGAAMRGGSVVRDRARAEVGRVVRRSTHALAARTRGVSVVRLTMEMK